MIRFAFPLAAYLFIPWAVLFLWSLLRQRKINRSLRQLGNERIHWYVLGRVRFSYQVAKKVLFYAGLGLLLAAAMGPKIGTRIVELKRQGVDVLFLLDTSTSMDAQDVKPSRMEKAKYEVGRLITGLQGDRVGMIVFAGTAHLHFPLTSDYAAARLFLNAVDTRLIQTQGTVIAEALELAMKTFDPQSRKFKTMVVLSDGEDHDGRAHEIARAAAEQGIIIHSVGIGSQAGAPIPIDDGTAFKKDRNGRVVTSLLNELVLEELADAGSGTYTRVDNRSGSLAGLLEEILAMEKRVLKSQEFSQYENRYQLFLLPALICFIIELLLPGGSSQVPRPRSRYA